MRTIAMVTLLCAFIAGCTISGQNHQKLMAQSHCVLPAGDQAWIDRAVAAWHMAKRDIARIGRIKNLQAVFFSADCVMTSSDALTEDGSDINWKANHHEGSIALPDGDEMPAVVTSFTNSNDHFAYFVMSTPSVWRNGGVDSGPFGLETLMVAVMLHEGSHVVQSPTYGRQVTELQHRYSLPDSFGDDSLQARFENHEDFRASIESEIDLFFRAAAAADEVAARQLAREARDLMHKRAQQWYTGGDEYWREGEDIWLTFEGSGQWVGYQWLISEQGADIPESLAMSGFARRSKWWSQNEGLAIVLTLNRLSNTNWKQHVFGDGEKTVLELLDVALGE